MIARGQSGRKRRRAGAACRSGGAEGTSLSARNLEGAEDSDVIYGGGGNDRINAVDGNEDIINCGRGKGDVAFNDDIDTDIRECNRKIAVE